MIASLNATFLRTTSAWKAFRRETDGNATIEAVLWLPLFVVFLVMIADVSFVFHRQSQIMNIVQDGKLRSDRSSLKQSRLIIPILRIEKRLTVYHMSLSQLASSLVANNWPARGGSEAW